MNSSVINAGFPEMENAGMMSAIISGNGLPDSPEFLSKDRESRATGKAYKNY